MCDQIGYPKATATLPHLDERSSLSGKQIRDLVYGSDGTLKLVTRSLVLQSTFHRQLRTFGEARRKLRTCCMAVKL